MFAKPRDRMNVAAQYEQLLQSIRFDPRTVFTSPAVRVWRKLSDRENCTLDFDLPDGRRMRFHIKRFPADNSLTSQADIESRGWRALEDEQIPCAPLVGWGKLKNRSSFIITEDLTGYEAADKLIESGTPFEPLLIPTAELAAKLHNAKLHHRDLYLCHFFAKLEGRTARPTSVDVKLIDAARVRRLTGFVTRQRWINKDLAQFWYSTTKLPITDDQRDRWLARYAEQRGLDSTAGLKRTIVRKARRIALHDVKLNRQQPKRHVSIPKD
jgi:Lipopolysaccharide kinase (Kdo/WaaP) family